MREKEIISKKEFFLDEAHEAHVKRQKLAELWAHENDFVFIDHAFRPYRVRLHPGGLWLHYWTASKSWATLRKIDQRDHGEMLERALPFNQEKMYEGGVPFLMDVDAPQTED